MRNKDRNVRATVASILSSVYSQLPDQRQFWEELIELTSDEDIGVRRNAYYCLGKISICKASQAENEIDYRREFEQAIKFFEKTSQESTLFNPSQFCLPFYRSFYAIISDENQQAKNEVAKYLTEARSAVKRSKNKELLFEAVDNLAKALEEVQSLENRSLEDNKEDLSHYMEYCERAADLMSETEQISPYATEVLRRGLPILNRKLNSLIEEIRENAKTACQASQGTPTQEIACTVSKKVQNWKIGSQEYLEPQIDSLVFMLKSYIPDIEENSLILNRIDQILHEQDIVKQYILLNNLIPQIIDIQVSTKTTPVLNEIKSLRDSVDRLIESVDELQNPQEYLDTIQRDLEEIKNDMPEMKGKIEEVLYELYSPLSTTQKLKAAIPIIPLLVSYEIETDVPRLVADKIYDLKNLILSLTKSKKFSENKTIG